MTAPENFVSRWARLKRESGTERGIDPTGNGAPPDAVASADAKTTAAPHGSDEAVEQPFDMASLPSIETITVDTDIRGFLQSQVPAELTRAALRQAWASDPAIRDFIGIAENQWDFNDPNAIPGFGPLSEKDSVRALAQAVGRHDRLAQMVPETPVSMERSLPDAIDREPADPDVQPTLDGPPPIDSVPGLLDDSGKEDAATEDDAVAEGDGSPRKFRSHGGALPR
jgi:hypothetical protein